MVTKQEIFDFINDIIVDEKGQPIQMNDKFIDSGLDSLGILVTLITLDAEYPIFKGIPEEEQLAYIDVQNVTMRELVIKCKSSTISASPEPSSESDM